MALSPLFVWRTMDIQTEALLSVVFYLAPVMALCVNLWALEIKDEMEERA